MKFPISCAGLFGILLAASNCCANPHREMTQQMARLTFQLYQQAVAANLEAFYNSPGLQVKSGMSTKERAAARQQVLEEYLAKVVPAMKLADDVAHIPEEHPVADQAEADKMWTRYYSEAKHRLRPRVKYEWSSNERPGIAVVALTEEHVDTLRDNFDVVMWYRDELDEKSASEHHVGAQSFRFFLDHIIDGLLDGLPEAPEIDISSGKVSIPEWTLDEKTLQAQLAMAYRYLIAKYQVYTEYEEFAPADNAVLTSLMKLAYLMGAQMDFQSFEEMDVELGRVGRKQMWKRPIARALDVLKDRASEDPLHEGEAADGRYPREEACVIVIPPPQPKQQPEPTKPPPEEGQKIEIIIRPKDS